MVIAILLFDRLTALDAVPVLTRNLEPRFPVATVKFVAEGRGETAATISSLAQIADAALDQFPSPDIVVVPGRPRQAAVDDEPVLNWVVKRTRPRWTTSVCTGSRWFWARRECSKLESLSTGWLTTLRSLRAEAVSDRVVIEGKS